MTNNVKSGLTALPLLEDLAEFSGLSGPETQLAISKRIDEYQQQIAQINERILELKSIHNAVTPAPFHKKLPSEILIHIFRHIEPKPRQHIRLSHVCRLWRSAIHQAPEFWVDILRAVPVIGRPHGRLFFKTFVERTAPLSFGLSLRSSNLTMIRQLPNHHRLTFLSIIFSHDYGADLLDLIDMELPCLRHLKCDWAESSELVTLPLAPIRNARTSDRLPHLRTLNIHGRCITAAFVVPSLRDLRIFGAAIVSPNFILNALRACPGPALRSSRLRRLTLNFIPGGRFASLFLSHLKYPPTTQVKIIGETTLLSDYLCHFSPPTPTPATSTIQSLVFTLTPDHNEDFSLCEVKGSSDLSPSRLSMLLRYGLWEISPSVHDHMRRFLDVPSLFSSLHRDLTQVTFNLERGLSVSTGAECTSGVHESLVLAIESRAAMDVSRLDELRFYTQPVARRKKVDAFPPFSTARLERLKAHVRDDVYTGAKDGIGAT
ncbi:hypothetical protein LXA43DRAFT_1095774 [Ganoderma leucocontextum]|nr:hypothetical protein LXA43DRAFT_1095774 [Ganoderma leucocontextum]